MLNGADFLTVFLFHNLGLSTGAYLAYTVAVAVAFAVAVMLLRRKHKFNPRLVVPVLIESAIDALTMGSLILFVMTRVLHVSPRLAGRAIATQGFGTRFVMSLGAGVWEETIFRLGILTGVAVLLEKVLGLGRGSRSRSRCSPLRSLFFSAMHHIPPYGDPLHLGVFVFRVLAGCFFGLVFWFRGFAIVVYTHALYDLYVLLFR